MRGQSGFWDVEERYALLSESGDPLEKLDVVIPWEVFRKPLAKALKRSDGAKGGRPPLDPLIMFKILVLQALYDLSDDQAEFVINDRLSCRVGTMDCSIAPLTEPDMRTTHPALWIGPSKCQLKLGVGRYLRGVKFLPSGFQRDQSSCEPGNRIGPRHARTVGLVPGHPRPQYAALAAALRLAPIAKRCRRRKRGSLLLTPR